MSYDLCRFTNFFIFVLDILYYNYLSLIYSLLLLLFILNLLIKKRLILNLLKNASLKLRSRSSV